MNKFPNAFVIILSVILFAWVLTFIIPKGNYEREFDTLNNRNYVVPNSYEQKEVPQNWIKNDSKSQSSYY